MKITRKIRIILILSLVLLNISCDQISKNVVRQTIEPFERIEVFKDSFVLTKVENTGAAYSLGSDLAPILKILLLQILPILVLLLLLRQILIKTNYSRETIIGFAFIIGGGIGNLFDRIVYGSVTDFLILDLGIIKTEIFNLADVSIFLGSILVLITTFFNKKETIFKEKIQ
ncbi:signal peptidase II [Aquimarina sp. EL_43]|uniref:signal peptidase II n=1 Tax=unclassified Aquimarina TaxID=2627091 RepID=UPI0018CB70C4|nr:MULTISPECIES: signal peptidase II [unclassified Aquimarina]MBG6132133.1 signal peptidase II [Aquimarina sp. EL_35]MBG6152930.1 signal peptidase II [Aquimarina sp. EL_32]MBG6170937.1 signal peptidase II [Aquimarina sp. EL_43]